MNDSHPRRLFARSAFIRWLTVAPNIEAYAVPGGYTTSLTRHVGIIADRIKACLDELPPK